MADEQDALTETLEDLHRLLADDWTYESDRQEFYVRRDGMRLVLALAERPLPNGRTRIGGGWLALYFNKELDRIGQTDTLPCEPPDDAEYVMYHPDASPTCMPYVLPVVPGYPTNLLR